MLFAGDCMRSSNVEDVALTFASVVRAGGGGGGVRASDLTTGALTFEAFRSAVTHLLELAYIDRLHRDGAAHDAAASYRRVRTTRRG
jgi:hypothetical protein